MLKRYLKLTINKIELIIIKPKYDNNYLLSTLFIINNEINSNFIIVFIYYFLLSASITSWVMDGYKLSNNIYIKYGQMIIFIIFIILLYYELININPIYNELTDNKNNKAIIVGGYLDNKETQNIAPSIKDAGYLIGTNLPTALGMGTVMAAGITATGKAIGSSAILPLQKVTIIGGIGIFTGTSFIALDSFKNLDKNKNGVSLIDNNNPFNNIDSSNPTINSSLETTEFYSSYETLFLCLTIISFVLFLFSFFLLIQIIFKLYIYDEPKLLFLNNLFNNDNSNNIKKYIYKYIKFSKKLNNIYIFIILISLFLGLFELYYYLSNIYENIDEYSQLYVNSKYK